MNPGFENHYDTSLIGIASFREGFVTDWSDPNRGSSDYFVPESSGGFTTPPFSFIGFEYPHKGYCYAGFVFYEGAASSSYEYIQAKFSNPLQTGKTYAIMAYVSLVEYSTCLSDLGFYFSDTMLISQPLGGQIAVTPQYENPDSNMIIVHNGLQKINGIYNAHGGEQYLSIGMFKSYSMAHTDSCIEYGGVSGAAAYLFIDDVAVYDTSKTDTINLCLNDSIQLGGTWRKVEGLYIDTIGGLPVNFFVQLRPYTNSVTIIDRPFESSDSVRISLLQAAGNDSVAASSSIYNYTWIKSDTIIDIRMYNIYGCDSTIRYICRTNVGINNFINGEAWSIYPNPTNDFLHIILKKNDPANYSVTLIDVTGREVLSPSLLNDRFDISALKSGIYFMKLINTKTGNVVGTEKFVKSN